VSWREDAPLPNAAADCRRRLFGDRFVFFLEERAYDLADRWNTARYDKAVKIDAKQGKLLAGGGVGAETPAAQESAGEAPVHPPPDIEPPIVEPQLDGEGR